MRPFTENDLLPLLPAGATILVLAFSAVVLASRRDVEDGIIASRDVAPPRSFGLGSAFGLSARLELPVLVAWCAGSFASGLMFGVIAKITATSVPDSLIDTLDKFGVKGSFATQYLGVAFLLVAAVVALLPAGQVGAASQEETSGRLVQVLAGATHRTRWFAGRLVLTGGAIAASGLLAGFGAWLGAKSQGVDLDLMTLLGAGLNVVPTALVVLGIGAVVLALVPRAASGTIYSIIAWSLIVDLLASMVSGVRWLAHVSLFHYMALAPAQHADARTLAASLVAAVVLCVAATVAFRRRDLRTV